MWECVCVTFCAAKKRWKSWRIFPPQKCALNAASIREKRVPQFGSAPRLKPAGIWFGFDFDWLVAWPRFGFRAVHSTVSHIPSGGRVHRIVIDIDTRPEWWRSDCPTFPPSITPHFVNFPFKSIKFPGFSAATFCRIRFDKRTLVEAFNSSSVLAQENWWIFGVLLGKMLCIQLKIIVDSHSYLVGKILTYLLL